MDYSYESGTFYAGGSGGSGLCVFAWLTT
jgi:hypothetical protein